VAKGGGRQPPHERADLGRMKRRLVNRWRCGLLLEVAPGGGCRRAEAEVEQRRRRAGAALLAEAARAEAGPGGGRDPKMPAGFSDGSLVSIFLTCK
jgi:hypothetical protein